MVEWKAIPGLQNYEASSTGQIRSGEWLCRRGSVGAIAIKPGRVLKPAIRKIRGKVVALTVNVRINGKLKTERIHRLVLLAFRGPCPEGMEGCHNNGDPTDNNIGNLRWDYHRENIADSVRHGTKTAPPIHTGENHHNATLTNKQVKEIRAATKYHGLLTQLARKFSVSHNTILRIRQGVSRRFTT